MSQKTCDDAISTIYSYLDGEISSIKRFMVRVHLRQCSGCEDAFAFEQRLKVVIRERCQEEVPADMIAKLRTILAEESTD